MQIPPKERSAATAYGRGSGMPESRTHHVPTQNGFQVGRRVYFK